MPAPAAPPPAAPAAPAAPSSPVGAPAAVPASPALPPPAASPAPAPIGDAREKAGSDAFAALDALAGIEEPSTPAAQEPPAVTPDQNGERARDDKGKFKPSDKAADKPVGQDGQPVKTAELRRLYDDIKAKHAKLEADYNTLKNTPRDDPEKKSLAEKLAAGEKRVQEMEARYQKLDEQLRFAAFERSEEYKQKYEQPYIDAFRQAASRVASLKVVQKMNEEGEVTRAARKATAQDFEDFMKIYDDGDAADFATDMFGPQAPAMIYHREEINKLNHVRTKALEDYQKNGAEREKQQRESWEKTNKELQEHWQKSRDSAVEKYPHFFKEDPEDAKGNELLGRSRHFVNRVLEGGRALSEGESHWTAHELAENQAAIYNKAVGFDRLVHRYQSLRSELKKAKEDLAEYEQSKPGPGDGGGRGVKPAAAESDDALAAFDSVFPGGKRK